MSECIRFTRDTIFINRCRMAGPQAPISVTGSLREVASTVRLGPAHDKTIIPSVSRLLYISNKGHSLNERIRKRSTVVFESSATLAYPALIHGLGLFSTK